ncbi:MAG: hypothetical protein HY775_02545 [Acidobacteria bacterium]|nr:hypothetical protein [Acidobacteriota bacterium]
MRRRSLALAVLWVIFAALLAAAGVAIASDCGNHDWNGSCETPENQVSCATGNLRPDQPIGARLYSQNAEVSVCSDDGPVWQGRVIATVSRPTQHGGGVSLAHDGDADNVWALQGWYRVAWFPMTGFPPYPGYVRGDCGDANSWQVPGKACGPQLQFMPASCGGGEGAEDFNGNCEKNQEVRCGTGMLPRGAWGKIIEPYDIWHNPLGASAYGNGKAEVSACNNGAYLGPQGRVYAATDGSRAWAAYDGDPSNAPLLRGWTRVSVSSQGAELRCGSGDSFYEAGSSC